MSRSHRHTPISSATLADSEAEFKRNTPEGFFSEGNGTGIHTLHEKH
jgi:hypothetical protein